MSINIAVHAFPLRVASMPAVRSDLNGGLLTCLCFIMYQEYTVICIFDQMHVNLIWYLYPFMLNKICLSLSLSCLYRSCRYIHVSGVPIDWHSMYDTWLYPHWIQYIITCHTSMDIRRFSRLSSGLLCRKYNFRMCLKHIGGTILRVLYVYWKFRLGFDVKLLWNQRIKTTCIIL